MGILKNLNHIGPSGLLAIVNILLFYEQKELYYVDNIFLSLFLLEQWSDFLKDLC